ncbi:MAG: HAMP domain-containing histidine kinase [Bacteroidetes bacterium]|nr:HAMP domain-containing histidine kinase [Bacteroidota bacterium]
MSLDARQKAVLLYSSVIFGAFVLIFLLVVTIFTQHFYSLNLFEANVLDRYRSTFTGIGILFLPAGLFFALGIGWIISRELYPKKASGIFHLDGQEGSSQKEEDFREKMHSVHSTIKNMQAAYEQIQTFSANASHELRTPLTIMRGEIELALRKLKKPEEYQQLLGSLHEEIMRLARILDDLLLIAKTEIGERPIELQPFDLRELVEEMGDEAEMYAEQAEVRFELGETVEAFIEADPLRIRRVLLNLIDNAVKYNKKYGLVRLSMRIEDDVVAVAVEDSGIGIPAEALPRLFERFYRVNDSGTQGTRGTGLGLYLVHWIIKNHGGSIDVSSIPDEGSIFTVYLPLRNPA